MKNDNVIEIGSRVAQESKNELEQIVRAGARKMLQAAIENEVSEYIANHTGETDEDGKRLVVRNGSMPDRELITGVGKIGIRQPRVNDKRPGEKFTSKILPPYMRRVPSIQYELDEILPEAQVWPVQTVIQFTFLRWRHGAEAKGD